MMWAPPIVGTACLPRLPKQFAGGRLERPSFTERWVAPNETALSYALLLLTRLRRESGLPIIIRHDFVDCEIVVGRAD